VPDDGLIDKSKPKDVLFVESKFGADTFLGPSAETNVLEEFGRSAAFSGVQAPIDGMSQLANKVAGSKIIPDFQIISAPMQAEFGSTNWHAQQIGGAVGMLAPFLAVNKGVGAFMKPASAAEAMSLRFKITQAAASGFFYDGVMRSVPDEERNFWLARLKHASVGAATFTTLVGTAHGLGALGKMPPAGLPIRRPFNNELFNHTVAGVAAGATNAQLDSLVSGKGFASREDTVRAGYTFAVVGLGLKGIEKGKAFVANKIQESGLLGKLREDLKEVPARTEDGRTVDVYQKIMMQPDSVLRQGQKARIIDILSEVHRSLYKIDDALPANHPNKGYQQVNWKHTRGEVDQVLDAAIKARKSSGEKLTAEEIEDAMIASIYSDSVKTPQNFIRHNIDAAAAAKELLPKYFDPAKPGNAERIEGIVEAIKEHQIGPPAFMKIMTELAIRNSIKTSIQQPLVKAPGETVPPSETLIVQSLFQKIDKPAEHAVKGKITLSSDEAALLARVGVERWKVEDALEITKAGDKVAKPFESVSPEKPGVIDFSQTQHKFLDLAGLKEWHVPNKNTPWYELSRRVIDGDSLINYASPDGWAKYAKIRGPGTFFQDKTVWDSLASVKASYNDALTVMSADVKPLAEAGLARTEAAVARVTPEIQLWIDATKQSYGYGPAEKVSFWDKDAEPLRYPEPKQVLEARDVLRLDFARKIGDQMEIRLRAQQNNYSLTP